MKHPKTEAQLKAIEEAINALGMLRKVADLSAWPEELREARINLHRAHEIISKKN